VELCKTKKYICILQGFQRSPAFSGNMKNHRDKATIFLKFWRMAHDNSIEWRKISRKEANEFNINLDMMAPDA
jgi:hypothetical protein